MRHGKRCAAIVVAASLAFAGCQGARGDPDSAANAASAFLDLLAAGDAHGAWQALSPATREVAYQDDEASFARDMTEADWSGVQWAIRRDPSDLDISWGVFLTIEGGSQAVPDFLFSRGILDRWREATPDNVVHDRGILVIVQLTPAGSWVVAGPGLDTSPLTLYSWEAPTLAPRGNFARP